MKKLLLLAAVFAIAGVANAEFVEDFEDDDPGNWSAAGGTTGAIVDDATFATSGSKAFHVSDDGGFQYALSWDIGTPAEEAQALLDNPIIRFDRGFVSGDTTFVNTHGVLNYTGNFVLFGNDSVPLDGTMEEWTFDLSTGSGTVSGNPVVLADVLQDIADGTVTPGFFSLGFVQQANGSNTVAYDTMELTPEPATMALLGLGGLAVLRRRRKA